MDVRQLQGALYLHLVLAGSGALALGVLFGAPAWGYAVALGCLATLVYYILLGRQVVQVGALRPSVAVVVLSLVLRQAVCLAAIYASMRLWGVAWWGCLAALLIGRNWVMMVAVMQAPPRGAC